MPRPRTSRYHKRRHNQNDPQKAPAILRGKDPEDPREEKQLFKRKRISFSSAFKQLKDQLTFEDELILLNSHRIVVPAQKRKEILTKLHVSHQGIERTKQRARQIVYWPGINSDIKNTVEAYTKCQEHQPSLQQEPLQRDPLPSRPFADVLADLFYYAGKTYLVYVDRLSGWIKLSEFSHDPSSYQIISTNGGYSILGAPGKDFQKLMFSKKKGL